MTSVFDQLVPSVQKHHDSNSTELCNFKIIAPKDKDKIEKDQGDRRGTKGEQLTQKVHVGSQRPNPWRQYSFITTASTYLNRQIL